MSAKTPAKIQELHDTIRELGLFKGFTPEQIRDSLKRRGYNCSIRVINITLKEMREQIAQRRAARTFERIDTELSILEYIRNEQLDAWVRSKTARITTETIVETPIVAEDTSPEITVELQRLVGGARTIAQPVGKHVEKRKVTETDGDPRWLEGATRTSESIRKLLGVDPAEVKRLELVAVRQSVSVEDLRKMDPKELARKVASALQDDEDTE